MSAEVSAAMCGCGARWTGRRIEHCTECHETFTGSSSGDKHRVGEFVPDTRRCLTSDEMRAKGMEQNARGQWTSGGTSPWAEVPPAQTPTSVRTSGEPVDLLAALQKSLTAAKKAAQTPKETDR